MKTLKEREQVMINIKHDLSAVRDVILVNNANLGYGALKKLTDIMNDKKSYNAIKHQRVEHFLDNYNLTYRIEDGALRIYQR